MKIILINPSQHKIYGRMRPPVQLHMGLAYLGAVLKKGGHDVSIIDMDAESVSAAELAVRFIDNSAHLAGITVTTPTLSSALEAAGIVREASPRTKIVFGGMHPSVMPRETISYNNVDFVVKGEGEMTLLELTNALSNDGDLSSIDGILFKDREKIIENKDRALIEDLDSLPFPARELFSNRSYTYPDSQHAECAPIITSRGCPGRCTYCNAFSIFGRRFRARSAANIADEIEFLIKEYGVKEIHIWDDNFVTLKQRVVALRDEIKKRDLKIKFAFPNGVRADFLDEDTVKALKEMGTYSLAIGVESGSQRVLDKAKKGIRQERVIEAFRLIKKYKMESWAFFMFGLPDEDMQAAEETIAFSKRLNPDIAKFHILKPYPGTEAYQYLAENSLLEDLNYDNYGIHTPPVHTLNGMSQDDLLSLQKRAYREFYFRPSKLMQQVLRIKSYNRLKLNIKTAVDVTKIAFKG